MRAAAALAAILTTVQAGAQHQHPPPAQAPAPAAPAQPGTGLPPGHAEVEITPDRQQLIGLRTAPAVRQTLSGTIRAAASVSADETKLVHVHSRLAGWVQELFVQRVGDVVEKGQPLYALYSQELFAAQQEYVQALRGNPTLARAARERLRLWDVPDDQIRAIARSGPRRAVIFRSPAQGTVIERTVLQGHYVEPEMMLMLIADLSRVWILADVYEFEVGRIDRQGTASVAVQGSSGTFTASVDYVYPTVDERTRTVRVRLVADNPEGKLRPGAFATAELPTMASSAVWVPEEALIDTGVRQIVYLALPQGRFRPVEVRSGRRAEGMVEIVAGVAEGQSVVVSAQFLVDSESRLRGATQGPVHEGH